MRLTHGLVALFPLVLAALGCSAADTSDAQSSEDLGEIQADLTLEVTRLGISAELMPINESPFPAGIASAKDVVFVGSPFDSRVLAYGRLNHHLIGELPTPTNGFILPFILKQVKGDRVTVLDAGGFPSPGEFVPANPTLYEYRFNSRHGGFSAELVRTVPFTDAFIGFSEDAIQLSDGRYLVNDAVLGSIWIANTDGTVEPGIVPETFEPEDAIPQMYFCDTMPQIEVGGVPFLFTDSTVPGISSMAVIKDTLYFTGSCSKAVYKVPLSVLTNDQQPWQRAQHIRVVSPAPAGVQVEELLGLTNNPYEPNEPYLYAADALQLRVIRIDTRNGRREVVGDNQHLFNFPSSLGFAPPLIPGGPAPLLTLSNQQHLTPILNDAITEDITQPPYLATITYLTPH